MTQSRRKNEAFVLQGASRKEIEQKEVGQLDEAFLTTHA